MGLVKITFDGSSVSSKQDADINYHVTGLVSAKQGEFVLYLPGEPILVKCGEDSEISLFILK